MTPVPENGATSVDGGIVLEINGSKLFADRAVFWQANAKEPSEWYLEGGVTMGGAVPVGSLFAVYIDANTGTVAVGRGETQQSRSLVERAESLRQDATSRE